MRDITNEPFDPARPDTFFGKCKAMSTKKYNIRQIVVCSVLSVCVMEIILWNSLQDAQTSNQLSGGLLSWMKPIVLQLFGGSEELLHEFIRKAAHFVEFAVLGACLCGVVDGICRRFWRDWLVFFPLFVLLSVAVTDEFIQSFQDRTSAVKDIILDFSGGVFGLAAACILFGVLCARKRREV